MRDGNEVAKLNLRRNIYIIHDPAPIFDTIFRDFSSEDLPYLYLTSLMAHAEDDEVIARKKLQVRLLRKYIEKNKPPRKDYWLQRLDQVEETLKEEKEV